VRRPDQVLLLSVAGTLWLLIVGAGLALIF
jgi:hypothetical protein